MQKEQNHCVQKMRQRKESFTKLTTSDEMINLRQEKETKNFLFEIHKL